MESFFKSPGFFSILGIIIGFCLGEGSRYIRYKLRIKNLKKLIKDELRALESQIPDKRKIIKDIIQSIKNDELLPGSSVGLVNTGYKSYFGELYEHLTFKQRNCLHYIYETLDVMENYLNNFENDLQNAHNEGILKSPNKAFISKSKDILQSLDKVENLIDSYLENNPIDIFADSK